MPRRSNRREFARDVGLVAAGGIFSAGTPSSADEPGTTPAEVAVRAALDTLRARYGKHLSEAQWKGLQTILAGQQASVEALRRLRLENHEEPDFIFSADVP